MGHFLVFVSAVSGYVWISVFASFVGVLVGIAGSTVRLKICVKKLKKLKSITQLSKRKGKSMVKKCC